MILRRTVLTPRAFEGFYFFGSHKDGNQWVRTGMILNAAAAAKSLQLCLTLCDPIDGSPPGSPIPGILQARTLEWVAISFSNSYLQIHKIVPHKESLPVSCTTCN